MDFWYILRTFPFVVQRMFDSGGEFCTIIFFYHSDINGCFQGLNWKYVNFPGSQISGKIVITKGTKKAKDFFKFLKPGAV